MTMSSIWDGIENAEIFERGNYVKPGFDGVVEVQRTIAKSTLKTGLAFIVEMRAIESNFSDHPVGSKLTWFQKMTDKTVAFPAVKAWVAACLGLEAHQKDDIERDVSPHVKGLMKDATDNPDGTLKLLPNGQPAPENCFIGIKLRLRTTQVKTQKGLDFTRYDWSPTAQ